MALALRCGTGLARSRSCSRVGTGPAFAAGKSAVLVIDANTGRVLHQSAADEPRHPASLAKMMTIYIAFELIEQGRLSPQTKIKFSANAAAAAPSKLDLDEGEEIALVDAIKILITKSANDVAVALAEHIAGSEEKFARLMTRKAHQLGMAATTFRNASGLPDDAQVTTARDMVTLALRLQDDFPKLYPLFATRTATYKDETFRNHNSLLSRYEGTDGLKTGYTRASGFNLVASVRRGKKHVVGAIFGGASAASRDAAMRTFLNMGLVKATSEKTRKPAAALVAQAPAAAVDRRIGAVPKPQRVPRPPVKAVAAAAPPPPAAALVSAEPVAAPMPAAPSATPPIEIARVRSVLVGPRPAGAAADEPREDAAATPPLQPPATASAFAPPAHLSAVASRQAGAVLRPHARPRRPTLDARAAGLQPGARRASARCAANDRGAARTAAARPRQGQGGEDSTGAGDRVAPGRRARRLPDPDRRLSEPDRGRPPAGHGARARRRRPCRQRAGGAAGAAGPQGDLARALLGLRRPRRRQGLHRAQAPQDRLPRGEGGVAAEGV